jgi:Ca2+/Na+ antiporter
MKLTTTVYKYKRAAPWMVVLIALSTVLFFLFSNSTYPFMSVIGIVLLFLIAIYAALRPKSIFSLRSVDERKLVLTPEEIIWGTWRMGIHEVDNLEIYIHSFDSFKHSGTRNKRTMEYSTEYGDRNSIAFVYCGIKYNLTFYLGTFIHYDTIFHIMQSWREKGIEFSARSAFSDSYIREHVKHFG